MSEKGNGKGLNKNRVIRSATMDKNKSLTSSAMHLQPLIHHLCSQKDDARGKLAILFCSVQFSDLHPYIQQFWYQSDSNVCAMYGCSNLEVCCKTVSNSTHSLLSRSCLISFTAKISSLSFKTSFKGITGVYTWERQHLLGQHADDVTLSHSFDNNLNGSPDHSCVSL